MLLSQRYSFLFVFSLIGSAISVAIPLGQSSLTKYKRDDSCGFDGNSDLYGLGIRLGVYFQWISVPIIYLSTGKTGWKDLCVGQTMEERLPIYTEIWGSWRVPSWT